MLVIIFLPEFYSAVFLLVLTVDLPPPFIRKAFIVVLFPYLNAVPAFVEQKLISLTDLPLLQGVPDSHQGGDEALLPVEGGQGIDHALVLSMTQAVTHEGLEGQRGLLLL